MAKDNTIIVPFYSDYIRILHVKTFLLFAAIDIALMNHYSTLKI